MRKLAFLIPVLFFVCSCDSNKEKPQNNFTLKWSEEVAKLLNDTSFVNPIVDSLKIELLNSSSDTGAINILNELAHNWRGKPNYILANEALQKSKSINYKYGETDAICRIGIYYRRIPDNKMADSILNFSLQNARRSGFKKIEAFSMSWLAGIYLVNENFSKAKDYFTEALSIAQKINDQRIVAFCTNGIGNVYSDQKNYIAALELFRRSLALSQKINDQLRITNCFISIADIYRKQNDFPKALDFYQQAMETAQKINDKLWIGYCSNAIGEIFSLQKEYLKALEYYERALAISKSINRKVQLALSLSNIAEVYHVQKNYSKALDYYQRSILVDKEIDNKNKIAFCLNTIGKMYDEQNDDVKALEYFEEAIEISNQEKNKNNLAASLINIGTMYFNRGNILKSKKYAENSFRASKESETANNIKNSAFLLYRVYDTLHLSAQALKMHVLYLKMKDSLSNNEQTKKLIEIEFKNSEQKLIAKQETEKKLFASEQAMAIAEIKKQKIMRNTFIVCFLLLGVLAFVIFRSLQQNKKAKAVIEEQKKLVDEKQKEILDSIHYAKRIQTALITNEKYIEKSLDKFRSDKKEKD